MTQDQIAHTLTQWAYDNLPLNIAPRVLFVNDPAIELGTVEITIRTGCAMPGTERPAAALEPAPPKALAP